MSSLDSDNEVFSFSSETPVSVFSNKCDTCGKSFAHSSSYRRHTRNQCVPRSRKRRRKLWSTTGGEHSGEDDALDIDPFSFSQNGTEGNITFKLPKV